MEIKKYGLGELRTNCYLVFDEKTKEGLIIDPADDANFLSEQILQQGIILKYLVATHGHFDHILAANELQLAFNVPFLINKEDMPLANKMAVSAAWWLKHPITETLPGNIQYLADGDRLGQLQVISTPGHSPGSICLYSPKDKLLFTGDTLFAEGVLGRTDFPYGSGGNLKTSIAKLAQLPAETIIYPGHGQSSTLAETLKLLS